jgi:hypothetical protein
MNEPDPHPQRSQTCAPRASHRGLRFSEARSLSASVRASPVGYDGAVSRPPAAAPGARVGQVLEVVLVVLASLVFVGLWLYVAAAILADGTLLADTWAWLGGLDTIAAIVVWVAILPIGVFLWAWQADLEPIWMGLVMAGLVGWTGIAWSGLARLAARRR